VKLAFSAPTRDTDQARELIDGFRGAGYEGLQLKTAQYRDYLDDPQRLLGDWPQLSGAVSGLIIGCALDDSGCEQLRRIFRFGGAVGADLVIFCHSAAREGLGAAELRGFAQQLDALGREAREHGTKLSLHQHYNQPCMHREDLDIFFDGEPAYGLTVDTAHLVKSGVVDVAEVIRTFREFIDNFHMKDYADGEFRVLGEGAVDFGPVFTAVREIGYGGWVAADEESGGDLAGGMRACATFLRRGLG